jgi:hypothetical protein
MSSFDKSQRRKKTKRKTTANEDDHDDDEEDDYSEMSQARRRLIRHSAPVPTQRNPLDSLLAQQEVSAMTT